MDLELGGSTGLPIMAHEAFANGEIDDERDDDDEEQHEELQSEVPPPLPAADLVPLALVLERVGLQACGLVHQEIDLLVADEDLGDILHHDPLDLRHFALDSRHSLRLVRVREQELHVLLQARGELRVQAVRHREVRPAALVAVLEIVPHALQKRERDLAPELLACHRQVREPALDEEVERMVVAHVRVPAAPLRQLHQTLHRDGPHVPLELCMLRQHRRPARYEAVDQLRWVSHPNHPRLLPTPTPSSTSLPKPQPRCNFEHTTSTTRI